MTRKMACFEVRVTYAALSDYERACCSSRSQARLLCAASGRERGIKGEGSDAWSRPYGWAVESIKGRSGMNQA
jgi:hypothetical protein